MDLRRQSSRSVLIVDDDADARATLREMLEELGLGVVEAPHGEAALAVLTSEREADIHVILLDLRMPVMNGWDFLELLPKYARLSAIPIVVVSAAAHAGEASEHPSVVAWFRAPYAMSQLREVVSSLAPS